MVGSFQENILLRILDKKAEEKLDVFIQGADEQEMRANVWGGVFAHRKCV